MTLNRSRIGLILVFIFLACLAAPHVHAGQIISEEKYVLDRDEIVSDDLYVFGNEIVIAGEVQGDLIATGGTIRIESTGRVEGDFMAAAREIVVAGEVGDDVRLAAFRVALEDAATIGDDALAAGYSFEMGRDAMVGGDVRVAGRQGLVNGIVSGDVRFAGAGLVIGGQVAGDVYAEVDAPKEAEKVSFGRWGMPEVPKVDDGLRVEDEATIDGSLVYTAPEASDLPQGIAAAVKWSPREKTAEEEAKEQSLGVKWLLQAVKNLIALLVVGAIMLLVLPRAVQAAERIASARPLPSAGWGCLTLVGVVVGLLLLAVLTIAALAIVGLARLEPLAVPILSTSAVAGSLLTFGVVVLIWVAKVVVSLWIGRRLLGLASAGWAESRWAALLLGAIIFAALATMPFVGWLFWLIGVLIGLGSIVAGLRGFRRRQPPEDTAQAVIQPVVAA